MSISRTLWAVVAGTWLLWGSAASAASVSIPIASISAGGATWSTIGNTSSNSLGFGSLTHFTILDATFAGQSDAYDAFHHLAVDGVAFANADNDVDWTGTTLTTDTVTLSGLQVRMQYFFDPASPTVRVVGIFENPTTVPITVSIRYGGNLGSDSGTHVQATDSGDTTLSAVDRWSITDDSSLTAGDPALTMVYYGPGNPVVTPTAVNLAAPSDQLDVIHADYTVTVAANDTVRLMWFGTLSATSAHALNHMDVFDDNALLEASGLLAGLSAAELATIANWDFDAAGPLTSAVVAVPNPVAVNADVTLTATVDDSPTGSSPIIAAEYSLDGASLVAMAPQDGAFDAVSEEVVATMPTFPESGVHEVCVMGTDAKDQIGPEGCLLLAVYDPNGGFVTGGGWIVSPPGAYVSDPLLEGTANFGFVAKYKKGATIPTGQTQFRFQVANLTFHSESYDWLVVAGPKAMFKGIGSINNTGTYGFMLTAIDEKLTPSTDVDWFRIKIWDTSTNAIVYDSQVGCDGADDADPCTAIGGGNIAIHKGK